MHVNIQYVLMFISPRPPLPLSATLSEPEAAIIIQACVRGFIVCDHVIYHRLYILLYQVRCRPEVQQFRQWQKGFRKVHDVSRILLVSYCCRR